MSRHSLLVAFFALVAIGAVPVAVRLLTATYGRPGRHRSDAARAGGPVRQGPVRHSPSASGRRPAEHDHQVRAHRIPDLASPADCPRTAPARRVHGGNVLVDRGHGYVL